MPIQVLTHEVVSQIAAGEVVERPVSVVKELVENSLDAGASQISIEVRGGGVSLIRVADNGTGIPAQQVELAFHRYATSKISSLADLDSSLSLGFRGEALPSIAAVAQVDLLTRTREDTAGSYVSLRDGEVVERGSRGSPEGTTVVVRGLFRNVPARLKFLKSSNTESGHIAELVGQYGLAFPRVRFALVSDGRRVFHTSGSGRQRDVLVELYGLETAQAMLEIGAKPGGDRAAPAVSGYISPPAVSRASRGYLSFFINGRWVQSRPLARAVEKAYEGRLMTGRYPIAVLNLSLPPGMVDVNVHPSKRQVRFSHDQAVFSAVYEAVHRELDRQAPIPQVRPQWAEAPPLDQAKLPVLRPSQAGTSPAVPPTAAAASAQVPILRVLGQLANTYIIAEGPDGLYLIDQHAAHERVMFERIMAQRAGRTVETQGLLEPLTVELSPGQRERLKSRGESLERFGIQIEPFGDKTYLVRAVPAVLKVEKIAEAVGEILDSLEDEATATWEERIALSLACHSAVRAGQDLDMEEIRELVRQLERTSSPRTCPHGRPTMIHLSSGQLAREFGRG